MSFHPGVEIGTKNFQRTQQTAGEGRGGDCNGLAWGGGEGASEVKEDHVKIFSLVIVHQRDQCDLHPTKQL